MVLGVGFIAAAGLCFWAYWLLLGWLALHYLDMKEWIGDKFDSEKFSVETVNRNCGGSDR